LDWEQLDLGGAIPSLSGS